MTATPRGREGLASYDANAAAVSALKLGFGSFAESEDADVPKDIHAAASVQASHKRGRRGGSREELDEQVEEAQRLFESESEASSGSRGVGPHGREAKRRRATQAAPLEPSTFSVDTVGLPGLKDRFGRLKYGFFPVTDRLPGEGGLRTLATESLRQTKDIPPERRRLQSCLSDSAAAPASPPPSRKQRYFKKLADREVTSVPMADQLPWRWRALASDAGRCGEDDHTVAKSDTACLPEVIHLASHAVEGSEQSWGSACRSARQEALHSRCRRTPSDVEAWREFAEFQWSYLYAGMIARPAQVREKQRSILDMALLHNPNDKRLQLALALAENPEDSGKATVATGGSPGLDPSALLATRKQRLEACDVAEAAEDLVWDYLEAAALPANLCKETSAESASGASMGTIRTAVRQTLAALALRKGNAGHDGKAIIAWERAELAAISFLALMEASRGGLDAALALLQANASINLFFPSQEVFDPEAFGQPWRHGCRLGERGALVLLKNMRFMQAAASGVPVADLPGALADLNEFLDKLPPSPASGTPEQSSITKDRVARLLQAEGGPMRQWVARELAGALREEEAKVPDFSDLRPFLVRLRTDVARREAFMRLLDLLGAPTLCRHASCSRYRNAFADVFLPDVEGNRFMSHRFRLPDQYGKLGRAALQGLLVWPGDVVLLETLLEVLWQVDKSGSGKAPRRVLKASEDPRLYFMHARALFLRDAKDAARAVFLKLAVRGDLRIIMGWWQLELLVERQERGIAHADPSGMGARSIRILRAAALHDFKAEDMLSPEPLASGSGIVCLQAALRMRQQLAVPHSSTDATGCRALISSRQACVLATCVLEARRSPQQALESFLKELPAEAPLQLQQPSSTVLPLSSTKAGAEEARSWASAARLFIEFLMGCPTASPALLKAAIHAALHKLGESLWLYKALAAVHVRARTLATFHKELSRVSGFYRPPSLQKRRRHASLSFLRTILGAEMAVASATSFERCLALCERAHGILGLSPFTSAAVWQLQQTLLLTRDTASRDVSRDVVDNHLQAEREQRWRLAVRAVHRHPLAKSLWLLQLAAWEARADGTGKPPDEEELVDLLGTLEARKITLSSDPLEAIA
eukprot:TRINITY_DN103056_c0_g1_i1.p1 TRINITY_DN103056_c0_g1~~TRINITY_DN103056_c0_g1_i1.p1  ORF type:complete len:1110 (+),score=208.85 TRINITY_DN103056_c0_g1_i1:77-3406(+)